MHFAVLDHLDADGHDVIRFMSFNPYINYNQMKKMAGELKHVDFGNGYKAKRIALHAFLSNLEGIQLSTYLVKEASTSTRLPRAMDIVGEHNKQKQPLLSKHQI
eukprot:2425426-Amphidinium_carterae.2